MGAGLQVGFDLLSAGPSRGKAILCTDGIQNVNPKVTAVGNHFEIVSSGGWQCTSPSTVVHGHPGVDIADHGVKVHAIGVGVAPTYADTLEQIATSTGGFFQATDEPQNDLDLAYFIHLCDVLAGGSPELVHHAVGSLSPQNTSACERFLVNETARKLTIIVSWEPDANGELTFWLSRPDGTGVPIQADMLRRPTYAMATIRLPSGPEPDSHIGQWTVNIQGHDDTVEARSYHLLALVDDGETKLNVKLSKSRWEVGDHIPVVLSIESGRRQIALKDVQLDLAAPRISVADVLSDYRVSRTHADPLKALNDKLKNLAVDPQRAKALVPKHSMKRWVDGDFRAIAHDRAIETSLVAETPGLLAAKIVIIGEDKNGCPVQRTARVSLLIDPGKADASMSSVGVTESSRKGETASLVVTPRSSDRHHLGPGRGSEFDLRIGGKRAEIDVIDDIDGTYRIAIRKGKGGNAVLTMDGSIIWEGKV